MADDSVSPLPVADNTSPAPVAPPDQTTQSTDIGQQPEGTWPNSTNLANLDLPADLSTEASAKVDSSSLNLANDQMTNPVSPPPASVEEKPPEPSVVPEPPKEETAASPPPEIGQVVETPSDTTWPDSPVPSVVEGTKMANEGSADSSNLANSTPPTDQTIVSADSPIPSIPPVTPVEPVSSVPVGSPPPARNASQSDAGGSPSSPSSPPDTSVPPPEVPPIQETTPEPSEAVKPPEEKVDTNIQSPDNQAPQVQPEALNDVPITITEKPQDNMANFKPEPPEQPQEAPLANLSAETLVKEDQNVTDSSQKSFGDLLSSESQPPSSPPIPPTPSVPSVPSSPSISFGDLIKDLKPEESVIPTPPIPSELTILSTPPQNSPSTPPTSSPTISPIPNLPPIANIPPISQTLSDQLSLRRQKANQVRLQKKAKHLNKIMELARNSKSISNTDIQRLLHVSQSTATNYLSELSSRGILKREGIRGGAKYTL